MQYVYFDSGTTNSRAYYIEDKEIKAIKKSRIGTADNVNSGNPDTLVIGLKKLYDELLQVLKLEDKEIDMVCMSGMATSRHGVKEVPFVSVPADRERFKKAAETHFIPEFKREIMFFSGLTYRPDADGTLDNIETFHNVRGEEMELFGIIGQQEKQFKMSQKAVVMPGSHTHILYVEDAKIVEITSCMGGEFYQAAAGHTILKSSVSLAPEQLCEDGLKKGYRMVCEYGMNRALYITRALELFTDESQIMRESYLEGVIHADLIKALLQNARIKEIDEIIIAGKAIYGIIFKTLCEEAGIGIPVTCILPEEKSPYAPTGFVYMIGGNDVEN